EDEGALTLLVVDVEPAFLGEAGDGLAEQAAAAGGIEVEVRLMIGAEGFVGAGVEVAYRPAARGVDGRDRRRVVDVVAPARCADRVDQEIDVEDRRPDRAAARERDGGDGRVDAARGG